MVSSNIWHPFLWRVYNTRHDRFADGAELGAIRECVLPMVDPGALAGVSGSIRLEPRPAERPVASLRE
ncbi:MAG: hypothetical protein DMD35_10950 [Gemmatimonadetes bacterium]|nr:MAG: hypothetical protein DMD35_10950 [Gemmatimonadota bacterium]